MKLPDIVNLLGKVYRILYVDKPSDVDIFKRNSYWGQIDPWTRSIRIYKGEDFPIEEVFHVLLHEVMHGIVSELYLHDLINADKSHKEEPIDLIALALADFLIRNKFLEFKNE